MGYRKSKRRRLRSRRSRRRGGTTGTMDNPFMAPPPPNQPPYLQRANANTFNAARNDYLNGINMAQPAIGYQPMTERPYLGPTSPPGDLPPLRRDSDEFSDAIGPTGDETDFEGDMYHPPDNGGYRSRRRR